MKSLDVFSNSFSDRGSYFKYRSEGSRLFLDSFWVGQGRKIDDTFPCYLGSMLVKFFNKGVWATGFSRNVWNMDGCFLHCMIAVWKMPTHYWKTMSQVACLVAAVLHQGALGELPAAALEVLRGCLNFWMWTFHAYRTTVSVSTQNDTWRFEFEKTCKVQRESEIKAEIVTAKV